MSPPLREAVMKRARSSGCFVAAALFAMSAQAFGQTPALPTLRVEGQTITVKVARANCLFTKYGIDVQSSTMSSSDSMRADLASGKLDITDGGLDNALALVVLAGVDVVIVTGSSTSDQELMARPEIRSIQDLRGKTIIVDAPNTQNALMMKKMLSDRGLKPGADYQMKVVGTQRLPELLAHPEYAAAMLSGVTAALAERHGYVSVAATSKLIGPLLYGGAFVRRDWARGHADLLERYIAANIEAQRWILNPANKNKMIEILRGSGDSKVPADVADEVYEGLMSGPGALTKDLRFDLNGFTNLLKLRAEVEGSWGGAPPPVDTFYDLSYYKKALAMVKN